MIRLFAALIGLFFAGMLVLALFDTVYLGITEPTEKTADKVFHKDPKSVAFSYEGPFGSFDRGQLQRGLKVYKEVCAACHSMNLIHFRNFEALGYSPDQVKALAAEFEVPAINPETGEAATRKGLPTDKWPDPYANEVAARAANNNALPPDLSLITKARKGGAEYVYSLLVGYEDMPADIKKKFPDFEISQGLHYNPYFKGLAIAMAKPLNDGQVSFDDGAPNDLDSMAKDVSAFLAWTAEPKMEVRKITGWATLIFLFIFTLLAYLSYKNIWAGMKPSKKD